MKISRISTNFVGILKNLLNIKVGERCFTFYIIQHLTRRLKIKKKSKIGIDLNASSRRKFSGDKFDFEIIFLKKNSKNGKKSYFVKWPKTNSTGWANKIDTHFWLFKLLTSNRLRENNSRARFIRWAFLLDISKIILTGPVEVWRQRPQASCDTIRVISLVNTHWLLCIDQTKQVLDVSLTSKLYGTSKYNLWYNRTKVPVTSKISRKWI